MYILGVHIGHRIKMKIEGHTAIVTGAAGLLGKAFCQTLLENGARVSSYTCIL